MHRFTRAARQRAKPGGTRVDREVNRHHGDEFDEDVATPGHLTVIPVRGYTPHVPQTFDEMASAVNDEPIGRLNQLGPVIEGAIPVVTDNRSFESYLAAFDKRSNSQPDKDDDCTPDFIRRALRLWDKVGRELHFEAFDVDEDLYERWLAKFDPSKQARMRKAYDELFQCEDDAAYLGEKTLSVKIEALLKRYDDRWAPRLIYAGNDHFNALTGPVAMVLCERMVETFDRTRLGPVKYKMAYKTDDVTLAQHLGEAHDTYPECLEADFSANDLRQRASAAVVFDRYCQVVGAPRWFRTLLMEMQNYSVKNLAFGHRAQLANQLPTGTTITTPRNTCWNATIESVYAEMTQNEGAACVLGDDFLGLFKKAVDCAKLSDWVATQPKMKLTACAPQLSGQATLLSRRVCVETETPCMMPKLGKALARFNVRVSKNEAISDSAYMAGKALSYAYEFRHFPMFRDLFLMRYRSEEDNAMVDVNEISWFTRTSGFDLASLESSILSEKVLVSEDDTREFLMDAYGDSFGLVDALAISRRIILCTDIDVVVAPAELAVDWE